MSKRISIKQCVLETKECVDAMASSRLTLAEFQGRLLVATENMIYLLAESGVPEVPEFVNGILYRVFEEDEDE